MAYLHSGARATTSFWSTAYELIDSSTSSVLGHHYNGTTPETARTKKKNPPRLSHSLQSPAARSCHAKTGPSPVRSLVFLGIVARIISSFFELSMACREFKNGILEVAKKIFDIDLRIQHIWSCNACIMSASFTTIRRNDCQWVVSLPCSCG